MARVTVEDCVEKIPNRFELVLVASKRVRQLTKEAATPTVPVGNDKMTVVALREIAAGSVDKESINSDANAADQTDSFAAVASTALKQPVKTKERSSYMEEEDDDLAEVMGITNIPEETSADNFDDSNSESE